MSTDFVIPAILFVLGFAGALLMRRIVSDGFKRGRPDLPVEKGSVRLDRVGKKRKKNRGR